MKKFEIYLDTHKSRAEREELVPSGFKILSYTRSDRCITVETENDDMNKDLLFEGIPLDYQEDVKLIV